MVIWQNIIKKILTASLPTIILPVAVVILIIEYFGFSIDSLLAVIFLSQLYIIWAQLEVALRQTHLSVLEYDPEFEIKIEKSERKAIVSGKIDETRYYYNFHLINRGKHLARNIFILIDIKGHQQVHKFVPLTNIAPNETVLIYSFNENIFQNNIINVNIDYETVLSESAGITFVKEPKLPEFMIVRHVRMPGILLNSFEDLILISRLLTLSHRTKNIKGKEQI